MRRCFALQFEDLLMRVFELENGLSVVHHEMPTMNSLGVSLYFRAGARFEVEEHEGVSHLAEHLLLDGTKTHPTNYDLARPIEAVGGFLNGSTDKEYVRIFGAIPARHSSLLLKTVCEILTEPVLTEEALAREKEVVLNEIEERTEDLKAALDDLLYNAIWGDSPMGRTIGGSAGSLDGMDLRVMRDFLAANMQPRNAVLSVAGRISHEKLLHILEEMRPAPAQALCCLSDVAESRRPGPSVQARTKDVKQVYLGLGFAGVPWRSPSKFPLLVMNEFLANSMSSRLYQRVRVEEGLAYHVWSHVRLLSDTGRVGIFFITEEPDAPDALRIVVEELNSMAQGRLGRGDLEEAKERYIGHLELLYDDTLEVSLLAGKARLYSDNRLLEEVCQEARNVSLSDVSTLASRLFARKNSHAALICSRAMHDELHHMASILEELHA